MPDVDPSNSYGTPEGPELNTRDVPTEPDAGTKNTLPAGSDPTSADTGEELDASRRGPKE